MIRVLHCVRKMDRAGIETFIMNVFRNIDKKEVAFDFLCSSRDRGDYDEEIRALGGKIYYTPETNANALKHVAIIQSLGKWFRENRNKFDVVHLHADHNISVLIYLEALRRAKIKNVIVHSHNNSGPHVVVNKLLGKVCSLYKFEKFACSDEAGVWLFGKKAVKQGKVKMIPNGIDFAKYTYDPEKSEAKKRELGIAGKIVLGHIGRFSAQKNHKFLIEVFDEYQKINSNSVLLLVGRGELEEQIKKQVHDLGLDERVKFLGVREDVPELLQAMDVFVFPSLYEGLSVILLEVQAALLPVVTNGNISKQTIISNCVKLLPITDCKEWAITVNEMAKDGRSANTLYDNAMIFDIKYVANILMKFYGDITSQKQQVKE